MTMASLPSESNPHNRNWKVSELEGLGTRAQDLYHAVVVVVNVD